MADVTPRRATPADVDALAPLFDGYRRFYEHPAYEGRGWKVDALFDHYLRFF
jgi:hypothetical protein